MKPTTNYIRTYIDGMKEGRRLERARIRRAICRLEVWYFTDGNRYLASHVQDAIAPKSKRGKGKP